MQTHKQTEKQPDVNREPNTIDIAFESDRPGIASEGVEIIFPLSPKYALILAERTFFESFGKPDGGGVHLTEKSVQYFNYLQVRDSHRQIYSISPDFQLAEQICRDCPEICLPSKETFNIEVHGSLFK
jgi:hypothetical protein